MREVELANNGYGVYFAPYSNTLGNQVIQESALVGNTIASIAVSSTNQIDSSLLKNLHTGFSPYGLYLEPKTANVGTPLTFLTNSTLMNVYIEAIGNGWIYGNGETGLVANNTIIGGGYSDVGAQVNYALPNGSGGHLTAPAVVYVTEFDRNTMINTNWSSYGSVTDAILETDWYCVGNLWINDQSFVFNATASVPSIKCSSNMSQDRFLTAAGDGLFRTSSAAVAAGAPLADAGGFRVTPFTDGRTFAGLAATPAGANGAVGVLTFADNVSNVPKVNPSQTIQQGQAIFATTGGGRRRGGWPGRHRHRLGGIAGRHHHRSPGSGPRHEGRCQRSGNAACRHRHVAGSSLPADLRLEPVHPACRPDRARCSRLLRPARRSPSTTTAPGP